jgi:CheY-like chemotaxis protein
MVEDYAMTSVPTIDSPDFPTYEAPRKLGVLVADDDSLVRTMLRVGLQLYGFQVYLAGNGREALEVYRQHRDVIDVVLLDVRMPGLDGPHTLEELRLLTPDIRCCFMSGETGRYPFESLEQWKPDHFFSKPFSLPLVARALCDLATSTRASVVT